jgi:hypothetical protein
LLSATKNQELKHLVDAAAEVKHAFDAGARCAQRLHLASMAKGIQNMEQRRNDVNAHAINTFVAERKKVSDELVKAAKELGLF